MTPFGQSQQGCILLQPNTDFCNFQDFFLLWGIFWTLPHQNKELLFINVHWQCRDVSVTLSDTYRQTCMQSAS